MVVNAKRSAPLAAPAPFRSLMHDHKLYYFWKWADNDLPGRPAEIMAALQRGEMPLAIQLFDPRRLLSTLRRTASRRPKSEQWRWDLTTEPATPGLARCAHVTRTSTKELDDWYLRFWNAFELLGLSGGVKQSGLLVPGGLPGTGLPPKANCFSNMQEAGRHYDVEPADVPALLRSIDPNSNYP